MEQEPVPFSRPIKQALIVIAIVTGAILVLIGLYAARWIVLAACIGLGIGVLVSPGMAYLKDHLRIPHGVGAALFFVLFLAVIGSIGYAIVTLVANQLVPLLQRTPDFVAAARNQLGRYTEQFPSIRQLLDDASLSGNTLKNTVTTLFSGLRLGATALGGALFVLAVALYLAISPDTYLAGVLSAFPAHLRSRAAFILHESAKTLRRWFGAQLIAMASVGAIVALGLSIVGVAYWPAFGLLTAILDIVPYIGPVIAASVTIIPTLGADPSAVPWVILVFVAANQLEGHIVIPLVMRGRISLPPIHLITLMLILGNWFGILGVLVAPPLLAVGRTIYLLTYVPRMNALTEKRPASLKRSA